MCTYRIFSNTTRSLNKKLVKKSQSHRPREDNLPSNDVSRCSITELGPYWRSRDYNREHDKQKQDFLKKSRKYFAVSIRETTVYGLFSNCPKASRKFILILKQK